MRSFIQEFQLLIRQDLPIYLIVAGLYNDIENLENADHLTFFLRAEKYEMNPLNHTMIRSDYMKTLGVSREVADQMAALTKGYAFAFQVLGWLYFEKNINGKNKNLEFEYTSELIKYCYAKIWDELTEKEIEITKALVELNADEHKVKREEVMKHMEEGSKMSSATFNTYRERLIGKGIIATSKNRDGYDWIELPQFGVFVRDYHF